jgi:hypothetical protein
MRVSRPVKLDLTQEGEDGILSEKCRDALAKSPHAGQSWAVHVVMFSREGSFPIRGMHKSWVDEQHETPGKEREQWRFNWYAACVTASMILPVSPGAVLAAVCSMSRPSKSTSPLEPFTGPRRKVGGLSHLLTQNLNPGVL